MKVSDLWTVLKEAYQEWDKSKAPRLGAALAYYTVLSLAPLVILLLLLAGWILGPKATAGELVDQIQGTVGRPAGETIQQVVEHANRPAAGILATIVGLGVLILGASGVFGQLQDALNTIWGVKPRPGRGIWGIIRDRFLSFSILGGTCFLLLVSLIATAALAALSKTWTPESLPGGAWLWQLLNGIISLLVVAVLFALVFKYLPDVNIAWCDVWLGAAVTALLFTLGKFLLGLYVRYADVASGYGAAGSLVVLLVWIYYSAQIFLFGAAFTRAYAKKYGSGVQPSANAELVTVEERARQGMEGGEQPATLRRARHAGEGLLPFQGEENASTLPH